MEDLDLLNADLIEESDKQFKEEMDKQIANANGGDK